MQVAHDLTDYSVTQQQFSAIINRLAPEKLKKLAHILSKGRRFSKTDLLGVLDSSDDLFEEYQEFINSTPLYFTGGSNSKNFVISGGEDEDYVLKLENRFSSPKEIDRYIRDLLPDVITPIFADHQVNFEDSNGRNIDGYIVLTTFCPAGSILDIANSNIDDAERIDIALDFFTQMGSICTRIIDGKCLFPDMKNSNWLVNEDGKLQISDTKTFLYIRVDGIYDPDIVENTGYSLFKTEQFSPREIYVEKTFSADKLHVGIFGRNLFQFLTKCDSNDLPDRVYNFDKYQIFNSSEGRLFKSLIHRSTQTYSEDRPSMTEVLTELNNISLIRNLKNEVTKTLQRIASLALDKYDDEKLSLYVSSQLKCVVDADEIESLEVIYSDLKSMLLTMKDLSVATEIASFVNDSLESKELSSEILILEINNLKDSLFNTPIDMRGSDNSKILDLKRRADFLDEYKSAYMTCQRLLVEIQCHKLSDNDLQMNSFIQEKQQLLKTTPDLKDYIRIKNELGDILSGLQESQELIYNIENCVSSLKRTSGLFSGANRKKANNIEKSLVLVPVEQRKDILVADTDESNRVRASIAGRNSFFSNHSPKKINADSLKKWIKPELVDKARKIKPESRRHLNDARNSDSENISDNAREDGVENAPKHK
ncbi:MAG: hypothetical protein P1U74_08825 [Legionellaceae bacterium]|nr:hypothetical protein [Legionellaceae bacterium]